MIENVIPCSGRSASVAVTVSTLVVFSGSTVRAYLRWHAENGGAPADVIVLDLTLGDGTTVTENVERLVADGSPVLIHSVADRPTAKYGFSERGWLPTRIVSADGVTSGHAAAELRMSPAGTHARWRYVEQADGTLTVNDFFSGTVSTGRFGPVDVDDTAVTVAGGPFESARVWSKTG